MRWLVLAWLMVLAACTDTNPPARDAAGSAAGGDDGGRATDEQLAAANEVLTETVRRLPGGPADPRMSLSYDDEGRPSHNYYFFSGEQRQALGFRGLEFDIHVDPRDAVLIAVVDASLPVAEKLVVAGYPDWYKDNWSGSPAFHEPSDIQHDRYHVAVYRCPRPLKPSAATVDEVVTAVLRFTREWKALSSRGP